MDVKILHTADLHLGSLMSSLEEDAPHFQEALILSFQRLLQTAVSEEVDLFLIAGDFLEMAEIKERELGRVLDILAKEYPFPILIVGGNHDPYSPASPYQKTFRQIPGVFVFPADKIIRLDFPQVKSSVWGASFASLYQETTLLPCPGTEDEIWIYEEDNFKKLDIDTVNKKALKNKIGLVHGNYISSVSVNEKDLYNPLLVSEVKNCQLDYLALGHIHKPSAVDQAREKYYGGKTLALYPGSPQGLSFNESGRRHALILEMENGQIIKLKQVETSMRMFLELKIQLTAKLSDQDIIERIMSDIKKITGSEFAENSYRIYLEGEMPPDFDIKRLEASLKAQIKRIKLYDNMHPPQKDLQELAEEYSLRGLFVKKLLEDIEKSEAESQKQEDLKQALHLGLKAFHKGGLTDVY